MMMFRVTIIQDVNEGILIKKSYISHGKFQNFQNPNTSVWWPIRGAPSTGKPAIKKDIPV